MYTHLQASERTAHDVSKMMLQIGDNAIHRATGSVGKVVGYGHQMLDSGYQPTLTVRLLKTADTSYGNFMEDLVTAWVRVDAKELSNT